MFFDQLPPDTSAYMLAGYFVFFLVTVIYLVSLFIRTRNLNQDLGALRSLEEENRASAGSPKPAKPAVKRTTTTRAKQARKKPARKR